MILIYQMGKVASTTIYRHLKALYPDQDVRHMHFLLTPDDEATQEIRAAIRREHKALRKVKIVTGVREPIACAISGLFENIDRIAPAYRALFEADGGFVSVLQNYFCKAIRRYVYGESSNGWPNALVSTIFMAVTKWFEYEFEPATGIDITRLEHVRDHGYQLCWSQNYDVLIYRFEDIARIIEPGLAEFLGLEKICLPQHNAAEEKDYIELYRRFKATLRIEEDLLNNIYDCRQVRTFYTPAEIERFKAQYTGTTPTAVP